MDLRQMGSPYEKKYIELTEEDRAKVVETYHNWQQVGYENTYENIPEFNNFTFWNTSFCWES